MKYDFLIVGAGLTGAVIAHELHKAGYKVMVVDKRNHIGGNIYTEKQDNIMVHKYGAHIFHTSNGKVWNYITQFGKFNDYTHTVVAKYKNKQYDLPFNMYTFSQLFNSKDTTICRAKVEQEINRYYTPNPKNLKEQALNLVGKTIYKTLIKGYTEKQWGRSCTRLNPAIIKRIPLRWEYNNNYFNDTYQGIPIDGYTSIIEKMLNGIDVVLGYDYIHRRQFQRGQLQAKHIIYTGMIDEYYNYCYGPLEYRSLSFKKETLDKNSYQSNAVVNYTHRWVPYTRIIEHKKFISAKDENPKTIITKEYPKKYKHGKNEPFYPVNDKRNNEIYKKYAKLAEQDNQITFCGRLGAYKYMDMDDCIEAALKVVDKLKKQYL